MNQPDDLLFALENVFERGRELEQAHERVKDCDTPSYWMTGEAERYDEAKRIFMEVLNRHIDQRIEKASIEKWKKIFEKGMSR